MIPFIRPSLRARALELRARVRRANAGLESAAGPRADVLATRGGDARPPRAVYARYRVDVAEVDGRRVFTLARRRGRVRARVLYLHGGAYSYEIGVGHWRLVGRLLDRGDVEVTVPLQPLAPEATCETVLAFVAGVYASLAAADGPPIAIAGDSSGGGLALALAQRLQGGGGARPAALVLFSPWLDAACDDPAQRALERRDPLLALPGLRALGRTYAGGLDVRDPRVSPLYGAMRGLPPVLTFAGTHEALETDARRLDASLAAARGRSTLVVGEGLLHVWPSMRIPEADAAIRAVVRHLGVERSA